MRVAATAMTLVCVAFILWLSPVALVLALPWIVATAWLAWRSGWAVLQPDSEYGSPQNELLAGFRGDR